MDKFCQYFSRLSQKIGQFFRKGSSRCVIALCHCEATAEAISAKAISARATKELPRLWCSVHKLGLMYNKNKNACPSSPLQAVHPPAAARKIPPPLPATDRAVERGLAPQADPHLSPRRLRQDHPGQRMDRSPPIIPLSHLYPRRIWQDAHHLFPSPIGRGVRGEGSLAVAGRIGQRPGAFQHLSDCGVTDNRSEYWRRSIGSPPLSRPPSKRS